MKRRNFLHNTTLGSAAVLISPLSLLKEKEIDWSAEWLRCKEDPIYFVETYCKVKGKAIILTDMERRWMFYFIHCVLPDYNTDINSEKIGYDLVRIACACEHIWKFVFHNWNRTNTNDQVGVKVFLDVYQSMPARFNKPELDIKEVHSDKDTINPYRYTRICRKEWLTTKPEEAVRSTYQN